MSPSSSGLLKNYHKTNFNLLNINYLKQKIMPLKCYLTNKKKYKTKELFFFVNKKFILVNNFFLLFYFLLIIFNSILLISCESHNKIVNAIHTNSGIFFIYNNL